MIKSGIKNYFANLKYYFTPIGTLAVGMIIGLSILIPGVLSAISSLVGDIKAIIHDNSIDFIPVRDFLVESIKNLDWKDTVASLKTMISREWLNSLFKESVNLIVAEIEGYNQPITQAVNSAINKVIAFFGVFVFFSVAGLICGFFLTKFLVRRNMAKRTLGKFIISAFVDSVLTSLLIIVCVWLAAVWKPSIFISSLVSLFLFGFVTLLEAYLVHGVKKVECKRVLSFKNVIKLVLTDFIIFYIAMIFVTAAVLVTNVIAGIFIGFSFVEIAFLVISMNAENYVISLIPQQSQTLSKAA